MDLEKLIIILSQDHMTRHAKKTHPSFYPEGVSVGGRGERTRFVHFTHYKWI